MIRAVLTKVSFNHFEIMLSIMRKSSFEKWDENQLLEYGHWVKKWKRFLMRTFRAHCKFCFNASNVHRQNHFVRVPQVLCTFPLLKSLLFEQHKRKIMHAYQRTLRRKAIFMKDTVKSGKQCMLEKRII